MPAENQDFVFCKSYRHKSGKIIVHPTGYFKFPRTRPLKEEKDAIRNKKSDDPDNSNSIS